MPTAAAFCAYCFSARASAYSYTSHYTLLACSTPVSSSLHYLCHCFCHRFLFSFPDARLATCHCSLTNVHRHWLLATIASQARTDTVMELPSLDLTHQPLSWKARHCTGEVSTSFKEQSLLLCLANIMLVCLSLLLRLTHIRNIVLPLTAALPRKYDRQNNMGRPVHQLTSSSAPNFAVAAMLCLLLHLMLCIHASVSTSSIAPHAVYPWFR